MHDKILYEFPYAIFEFSRLGELVFRNQRAESLFPESADNWDSFAQLLNESRTLGLEKGGNPIYYWVRSDGQALFAKLFVASGSPNRLLLVGEEPEAFFLLPAHLERILEDFPMDPAAVTQRIAAIVQNSLSFERLDIIRINRHLRKYVYEYSIGIDIAGVVHTAYSTIGNTGLGWMLSNQLPHLVRDFAPESFSFDEDPKLYQTGFRSILRVPIVLDRGVIGAILLASTAAGHFGLEDALVIDRIAQHVAPAFFHAGTLLEHEYQTLGNATLLRTVMSGIPAEQMDEFLLQYCLQLRQIVKAERVGLSLLNQRKNLRCCIAEAGKPVADTGHWVPLENSGIREMINSKSIVAFNLRDPRYDDGQEELSRAGFTAILYAPVENEDGEVIAALTGVTSDEQALSRWFAGIFKVASEQLGLILSQTHLEFHGDLPRRSLTAPKNPQGFQHIIGSSAVIRETIRQAAVASKYDFPILITGETGTGKELFAKAIHESSNVSEGPFIVVNSAAIPTNLLESELFGYQDGAFTGGVRGGRKGKILLADNGTLFLDEIGELSPELQAKILRVVQEQEVEPLGSTRPIPVHVRVISATHRNLKEMVRDGQFREDLLYRLNAIEITLPSLRERGSDVIELAQHLLHDLAQAHSVPVKRFSPEAERSLRNYSWPGNVRQLQNVIERLFVFVDGQRIGESDLPRDFVSPTLPFDSEQEKLARLLQEFNGNKTALADYLGITRTGLWKKLKRLGLQ